MKYFSNKTWALLDKENRSLIDNPEKLEDPNNEGSFSGYLVLKRIQDRLKLKIQMQKEADIKPTFGIAVDAWCSGNPGPGGYRGIDLETGEVLFQNNEIKACTNNIVEYLAAVHALGYIKNKRTNHNTVYSDSVTAIAWVRSKGCDSKFFTGDKPELAQMIWKCDRFLNDKKHLPQLLKWRTDLWGENPADFNRK